MDCQHVERFDRVCYDFPELRIVTYHGCEPWEDLAVMLGRMGAQISGAGSNTITIEGIIVCLGIVDGIVSRFS